MFKFSLVDNGDGTGNITIVSDGEMFTANHEHPCWAQIVKGAVESDPTVIDLFDVGRAIEKNFRKLSTRVSVRNETIYIDGDEARNSITQAILRLMNAGEDFTPLVYFFEKIQENPSENSREQLHGWLESYTDFTITKSGNVLAYKGVEDSFRSRHSGHAIVDGVDYNGQIPWTPGSTVEMPRSEVLDAPGHGCAAGLHVATHAFAEGWGTITLGVEIHPRDVVSVPNYDAEKMRVCRAYVRGVVESEIDSILVDDEAESDIFAVR